MLSRSTETGRQNLAEEIGDIREQIAKSPPTSLRGAIVKLRDALHPDLGLKVCDPGDMDLFSLQ